MDTLNEAKIAIADSQTREPLEEATYLVQFATATALIAIAEELKAMNERAEYQDERSEARIEFTERQEIPSALNHTARPITSLKE